MVTAMAVLSDQFLNVHRPQVFVATYTPVRRRVSAIELLPVPIHDKMKDIDHMEVRDAPISPRVSEQLDQVRTAVR
jgi:hypothetical protein